VYLTEHELKLIKNLEARLRISGGISGVLRHCLLEVFDSTYRFHDAPASRDSADTFAPPPDIESFIVGPDPADDENKPPGPLDILSKP